MNESKTSSQKITCFSAAQKDKLLEVLKEKKVLHPKWRIAGEWVGHPVFTCSVCPWGKYTTQLPTGGSETKGPAQACHSSEFRHLLSASNEEQQHTINICQIDYLKSRTLYLNMIAVKTEPSWIPLSLLNFFLWLSWVIGCTMNTGRSQFTISSWRLDRSLRLLDPWRRWCCGYAHASHQRGGSRQSWRRNFAVRKNIPWSIDGGE